jgi:hypothetical protein
MRDVLRNGVEKMSEKKATGTSAQQKRSKLLPCIIKV